MGFADQRRSLSILGLAAVWLGAVAGCSSFNAQGLNADGVRMFDRAQYSEAVRRFEKAAENDPSNADSYYNLASVYHKLGRSNNQPAQIAQAENHYNLCLARDPNHTECYRGLVVLLVEQGRREEAFRMLQSWADRSPSLADPKIELARLCQELGDMQAAAKHLADAVFLDPNNARAFAALGRLREQSGNQLQALQNYQQSLAADYSQPQVAARAASLQAALGAGPSSPGPTPSSPGTTPDTMMATQPAQSVR
jgi:tetratricopeptide (TPR) repeat protein